MTLDATVDDQPLYGVGALEAYRRYWQRIAVYSGRAGIGEYWWPALWNALVLVAGAIVAGAIASIGGAIGSLDAVTNALATVVGIVLVVLALVMTVAWIAVAVRRLHDADLSGLLVLTVLIPSVGGIILLVLSLLPSNPRGARYDRGAVPLLAPAALPAPRDADGVPAFDAWPAPERIDTATAPVPTGLAVVDDPAPASALVAAWSSLGAVETVHPPLSAPPGARAQSYLLVNRRLAEPLLATDGLHAGEGVTALGPGAELVLPDPDAGSDPGATWRFALLAAVARRVRASGLHLPAELERYGTLSMTLQGVPAPDGWRNDAGAVGVLLGVPLAGVPQTVPTAAGEVAIVPIEPLRPAELQEILDGGSAARARIAGRIAAMPEPLRATRA